MDDFCVDLDKVLDDFEESEDTTVTNGHANDSSYVDDTHGDKLIPPLLPSSINCNNSQNADTEAKCTDINTELLTSNGINCHASIEDQTAIRNQDNVSLDAGNLQQDTSSQSSTVESTLMTYDNSIHGSQTEASYVSGNNLPILDNSCDSSTPFNYQKHNEGGNIPEQQLCTQEQIGGRNGVNASSPNTASSLQRELDNAHLPEVTPPITTTNAAPPDLIPTTQPLDTAQPNEIHQPMSNEKPVDTQVSYVDIENVQDHQQELSNAETSISNDQSEISGTEDCDTTIETSTDNQNGAELPDSDIEKMNIANLNSIPTMSIIKPDLMTSVNSFESVEISTGTTNGILDNALVNNESSNIISSQQQHMTSNDADMHSKTVEEVTTSSNIPQSFSGADNSTLGFTGFADVDAADDISDSEMEAYLNADQTDEVTHNLSIPLEPGNIRGVMPSMELCEDDGGVCRDIPDVVNTPMEDPGLSRVPGYSSVEPSKSGFNEITGFDAEHSDYHEQITDNNTQHSEQLNDYTKPPDYLPESVPNEETTKPSVELPEESISSELIPSVLEDNTPVDIILPINVTELSKSPTDGGGARPKDMSQVRRNRPNSLLGLSKPDLRGLVEPVDAKLALASESDKANANDLINRQRVVGQPNTNARNTGHGGNLLDQVPPAQTNMMHPPPPTQPPFTSREQLAGGIPLPAHLIPDTQTPDVPYEDPEALRQKTKRPSSLSLAERPNLILTSPQPAPQSATPSPFDGEMFEPNDPGTLVNVMPQVMPAHSVPVQAVTPGSVQPTASPQVPQASANLSMTITQLGKVAPIWVPDQQAPNCMQCEVRFTFTKRRHHCRACGQVCRACGQIFCNACCNLKCKLHYMENKDARVCSKCYNDIIRAESFEKNNPVTPSPNPNNPSEYCSTIPPMEQVQGTVPPPTVMVPVGVLRKEGSQKQRSPKQVMFSDGIRPGGDLTELDGSNEPRMPMRRSKRALRKMQQQQAAQQAAEEQAVIEAINATNLVDSSTTDNSIPQSTPATAIVKHTQVTVTAKSTSCLLGEHGLPPVILNTGIKTDCVFEQQPEEEEVMAKIKDESMTTTVVFAVNKNLSVLVKMVNLDCCVDRLCWCYTTRGMCTVGQDEIVIVLECAAEDAIVPRDVFLHLQAVYEEASHGNTVSDLGHTIFGKRFGDIFLGSKEHCGFLYVRASFQCVQKLCIPPAPYVFGILLQQWETPWAKVFPIRLMLRLGAEFRYYPCPLISVRHRKPVCGEIGHTIMNLLADFRNFQYMLPQIRGVVIYMENKQTHVLCPKNRYNDVMKVLDNSNDNVMALGANFNISADSHLVCIQNDDGNYQTQAINIQDKPRKVTGASFVVFSGALKTSAGLHGKSSIVEDGLMVQILPESMIALKQSLRDMKDYTIDCGSIENDPEEQVLVRWTDDDKNINIGVKSPLDGRLMSGIESVHIQHATDYAGTSRTIRWTELFFLETSPVVGTPGGICAEPVDLSRLADTLAGAFCVALVPQLDALKTEMLTPLALKVNIHPETAGYEVGACAQSLPSRYMGELDNKLIPVIHGASAMHSSSPVALELIFHILE